MASVVIDYSPRRYFLPFHDRHQRYACIVAHRRAGKTTACVQDLQRAAIRCPLTRPRTAYIAPLLKQAKTVAWDILKAAATPLIRHGATINESELRVDYPNGGQVRLYGADNPDALRGIYLDDAVVDEPAQIEGDALFREVLTPALADRRGRLSFIGTPKGHDSFYQVWTHALANPAEWYSLRLPYTLTRVIADEEIANQREIQSASQFAREWECSFDEPGINQFIAQAIVGAAQERRGAALGPKVLGVDIARFGDDRSVALFRNGDKIDEDWIKVWRGLDTMQTVGRITELIEEYKPQVTFIDGVGVGGGVVDRLRQLGFKVVDVNGGGTAMREDRYYNSRAEMWGKMRDWLKDKGDVPVRDDLATDLMSVLYEHDHRNRIKLERKEDMKKRGGASPDIADALALTFARPVGPASQAEVDRIDLRWGVGNYAVPEADPLQGF